MVGWSGMHGNLLGSKECFCLTPIKPAWHTACGVLAASVSGALSATCCVPYEICCSSNNQSGSEWQTHKAGHYLISFQWYYCWVFSLCSLQEFSSESGTRFAWKHFFLRSISNPSLLFLCSHTKSSSMHTTGLETAKKSKLPGFWWHRYIDDLLSHEFGGRLCVCPPLRLGEDARGTDRAVALWI